MFVSSVVFFPTVYGHIRHNPRVAGTCIIHTQYLEGAFIGIAAYNRAISPYINRVIIDNNVIPGGRICSVIASYVKRSVVKGCGGIHWNISNGPDVSIGIVPQLNTPTSC